MNQLIILWSIILIVFLPDYFIPSLTKYLKRETKFHFNERTDFAFLPKYLGWVERLLLGIYWYFLPSQFTVFLGIWFALKTVGSFVGGINGGTQSDWHPRRAHFMVFVIGTGVSVASVILLGLFSQFLMKWIYIDVLSTQNESLLSALLVFL